MLDLETKGLKRLSEGDDFVGDFEKKISFEEGVSQGITKGITKGINQGITQRNIEIAKNLLKLGTVSIKIFQKQQD